MLRYGAYVQLLCLQKNQKIWTEKTLTTVTALQNIFYLN